MPDLWQVWYCPETDTLHLWEWVVRPKKEFQAEHIRTGKVVQMLFIGEL